MACLGEYLVGTIPFAGETLREFELDTVQGTCTAIASMGAMRPMEGDMSGADTVETVLSGSLALSGDMAGSGESSAILSGLLTMQGQTEGICSISSASIVALRPMSGVIESVCSTSAALACIPGMRLETQGQATCSAVLGGKLAMDVQTNGVGSVESTLSATMGMAGNINGQTTTEDAPIAAFRPMSGQIECEALTSDAVAVAMRPMNGQMDGAADVSAIVSAQLVILPQDGQGEAAGSVALGNKIPLSGVLSGSASTSDATMVAFSSMAGDIQGEAITAAQISAHIRLMTLAVAGNASTNLDRIIAITADGGVRVDVDTSHTSAGDVVISTPSNSRPQINIDTLKTDNTGQASISLAGEALPSITVTTKGGSLPQVEIEGVF